MGTKPFDQLFHWHTKRPANPQHRRYVDRTAGFDLLPMPRRVPVTDHIFLRPAPPRAQFPDAFSHLQKERDEIIFHFQCCTRTRAKTPRADLLCHSRWPIPLFPRRNKRLRISSPMRCDSPCL
jgi:hypothetical protein